MDLRLLELREKEEGTGACLILEEEEEGEVKGLSFCFKLIFEIFFFHLSLHTTRGFSL